MQQLFCFRHFTPLCTIVFFVRFPSKFRVFLNFVLKHSPFPKLCRDIPTHCRNTAATKTIIENVKRNFYHKHYRGIYF